MDVRDAVATRYSCRAFLPTPVSLDIVRDILERAARAPSGGNLQPWLVHALAGARLEALKNRLRPRFAKELPRGEGAEYQVYPPDLKEPYYEPPFARRDAALRLDRHPARGPARALSPVLAQLPVLRRAGRPVRFDRPHHGAAAVVRRRRLHPDHHAAGARLRAAHLRAGGLDLLAQDASRPSSGLPPEHILFCGIALGYADEAAPINRWRSEREPRRRVCALRGF